MPAPNQAKGIAGEIKSEKLLEDDSDLNVKRLLWRGDLSPMVGEADPKPVNAV
jgi:hypothetical protein